MIVFLMFSGMSLWSVVMLLRLEMLLDVMMGFGVCEVILCSSLRFGLWSVLFFVMLVMI